MPFGRYTCGVQWHIVLDGAPWPPRERGYLGSNLRPQRYCKLLLPPGEYKRDSVFCQIPLVLDNAPTIRGLLCCPSFTPTQSLLFEPGSVSPPSHYTFGAVWCRAVVWTGPNSASYNRHCRIVGVANYRSAMWYTVHRPRQCVESNYRTACICPIINYINAPVNIIFANKNENENENIRRGRDLQ